ncbi:hypothetical protein Bpfe_026576 [Biomphalaria pfeifferi]|uniref:Uncharacterized protein n=1 Tax=Biomphalaria pfeifferi TaxID=112525 RepID=A0AAD8EXD1_BIOPF|nr:hypothetical protein Bpfe_026576 [Biomphalaria pfeifferi]
MFCNQYIQKNTKVDLLEDKMPWKQDEMLTAKYGSGHRQLNNLKQIDGQRHTNKGSLRDRQRNKMVSTEDGRDDQ